MKRLIVPLIIFIAVGLSLGIGFSQQVDATVPGTNTLISVNNTGNGQGGNGDSPRANGNAPILSADGKFAAFASYASDLVSGDTNGYPDIFVRNLTSSTTSRVNVSTSGVQSNAGVGSYAGGEQAISETGRYVAFLSTASNLIDGQTISSSSSQIYMRDTVTNTTSIVTRKTDGTLGSGEIINVVNVSNDGRFILWHGTRNANLYSGGAVTDGNNYVYLADLQNQTFTLITPYNGYTSNVIGEKPSMSCDGSFAVLDTNQPINSNDTDTSRDIYLVDIRNGFKITNITGASNTERYSSSPTISCNGNFVTFASDDTAFSTLVGSGSTNKHQYLYNRINSTISIVDTSSSGTLANSGTGARAGVDNYGDVVFVTGASNLIDGSTTSQGQLYLKHNDTGEIEIATKTSTGLPSNANMSYATMSSDGKKIGFQSVNSNNLLSSDTNGKMDAIVSLTGL